MWTCNVCQLKPNTINHQQQIGAYYSSCSLTTGMCHLQQTSARVVRSRVTPDKPPKHETRKLWTRQGSHTERGFRAAHITAHLTVACSGFRKNHLSVRTAIESQQTCGYLQWDGKESEGNRRGLRRLDNAQLSPWDAPAISSNTLTMTHLSLVWCRDVAQRWW